MIKELKNIRTTSIISLVFASIFISILVIFSIFLFIDLKGLIIKFEQNQLSDEQIVEFFKNIFISLWFFLVISWIANLVTSVLLAASADKFKHLTNQKTELILSIIGIFFVFLSFATAIMLITKTKKITNNLKNVRDGVILEETDKIVANNYKSLKSVSVSFVVLYIIWMVIFIYLIAIVIFSLIVYKVFNTTQGNIFVTEHRFQIYFIANLSFSVSYIGFLPITLCLIIFKIVLLILLFINKNKLNLEVEVILASIGIIVPILSLITAVIALFKINQKYKNEVHSLPQWTLENV
ncbi:hypothetical protein V2E24_01090 [Mycoplasmopsis ciconiae]|uniref:Uncharacterized protein n=1 Tax=Mycoplasmopsis ciconiae TaxID=561067 RepID=A0ABU7MKW7_9BACT|nr:hypothetical protein [Mycoplasmopsis ciconiae]